MASVMAECRPITAAAVLDAMRAALRYLEAVKRLGRALERSEERAFAWTLLAGGEYASVLDNASRAECDAAAILLGELSNHLEPAGRRLPARRPDCT